MLIWMQYRLNSSGSCFDHKTVIFGSGRRPEILQRVQHAVAALGHERASAQVNAADALGRPVRVAAEQRVVVGSAQKADDPEFLNELIPQLLCAGLVERSFTQVAFDEDVEEGGNAANRHRRAVRFLDGAKIGEIRPLHRLLRIRGWP